MADAHPEAKLWDLMHDIRICMLTTSGDGRLRSRPMSAYVNKEERKIFFITNLDTQKTHAIADGDSVNLAFVEKGDETYVSLEGHARVVQDVARQKKLWNPFAEAWLPQGPEAADVALIEVTPTEATYWDSPSLKLVQLWQVAVANVTQTPPSGTEEHVKL